MNILNKFNSTCWELVTVSDDVFRTNKKCNKLNFSNFFKTEKEIEEISLLRTKRLIREICLCNNFEYFTTMTVSSRFDYVNRFDLENCLDNIKKILYKMKRKSKGFKFIFVIEKHKNGAYHFHGMMKNLPQDDVYENQNGYLSSHLLDKLGFNSFSPIKDYDACCHYIIKYITDDCIASDSGRRYFRSRDLKYADKSYVIDFDLHKVFGDRVVDNPYGCKVTFNIDKLSNHQKQLLFQYFDESEKILNEKNSYTNWLKLLTKIGYNDIHFI